MASKPSRASSLFITLLIITVLLIGGLSFLPVLALGPVAEHLLILGAL